MTKAYSEFAISLFTKLLAAPAQRQLNKIIVAADTYASEISSLTDEQIRTRFRARTFPSKNTLPEALALVREASTRALGLRPYAVQLMAAAALFDGVISEMKTGEGKTLAIGLAAALAALSGKGVHIATPNPYLATRDTEAMRPLYAFLGLTVGTTLPGQGLEEKQFAYLADITYGVHSELGFDYLRDHLVAKVAQRVQRTLNFAIVDEADSILIDEARTPLIITEPSSENTQVFYICDRIAQRLRPGADVSVDPKARSAHLTEAGFERVAHEFKLAGLVQDEASLYKPEYLHLMRYMEAAIRARLIYQRDRDYVVHNSEVLIVDESTGRTLTGRRWQSGVHQAIETREGLKIQPESETVAEITYQSYFGLYKHLGGLTGTALSAGEEFEELYGRGTLPIPTHRQLIRLDLPDKLYIDRASKFKAIVDDVHARHKNGQPILVGTGSVEESEALAKWFVWANLPHRILNARQNAEEAQIIQDAGKSGAITIATNMAGRGTDIVLGGHPEPTEAWRQDEAAVVKAGGLHVIGTQRHESRRVDDQLRGRSGRQGNPGSSRFYLSLEDNLLRVFGTQHFHTLNRLLANPNENFAAGPLIDKAVRQAQASMEAISFGARRQLVKTDRVIASQRNEVYALRESILTGEFEFGHVKDLIAGAATRVINDTLSEYPDPADWDLPSLTATLEGTYQIELAAIENTEDLTLEALTDILIRQIILKYETARVSTDPHLTEKESLAVLSGLDRAWREHLTYMDSLREGMNLKSYAQQNPEHVFAKDARDAFDAFQLEYENRAAALLTAILSPGKVSDLLVAQREASPKPRSRLSRCPCGSGRRFKHCHGQLPGWPRSQLAAAG